MGAVVLKDHTASIAACFATSGWDDLLDQFQNLFLPISHLDPKICKKLGSIFKNTRITF